ncbi:MAG: FAD-binding oxidoreductase, partial [Candidatus Kapabacteria bacterium]|nr:FAD-binding oxidoreductase [Candidatus Kapabacteria bacterium]
MHVAPSAYSHEVDYLIVGGGLAGCILTWVLLKRGLRCLLLDVPNMSNASSISAGIINPISGSRFSPLVEHDTVLAAALSQYASLEKHFGCSLVRAVPTLRLFASPRELEWWFTKRAAELTFAQYCPAESIDIYNANYGGIRYTAWHLNTQRLLESIREFFCRDGILREQMCTDANLSFAEHSIIYSSQTLLVHARRIIFCNGWNVYRHAFWSTLSLSPAKGEILTVESPVQVSELVICNGVFVLPLEQQGTIQRLRVGATYSWDRLDTHPTPHVAVELLNKAEAMTNVPMTLVQHDAGVRPSSRDRKPIIGMHPSNKCIAVFSGFGSKGAAYVPYCAALLVQHLEEHQPLPEWCALARWKEWRG